MNFQPYLLDTEKCSCCDNTDIIKNNNLTETSIKTIRSLDDYSENSLSVVYFNTDNYQTVSTPQTKTLL